MHSIRTASSSKSPAALLGTLTANGLPDNSAVQAFASTLYSRAPRKAAAGSSLKAKANAEQARKKAEKERIEMQKQRFSLVLDDEAPSVDSSSTSRSTGVKSSKDKGKGKAPKTSLRRRGDQGDVWESDEEEREAKRRREDERYAREDAQQRARNGGDAEVAPEEDEATRRERERLEDLKERDEFAQRMKEREKDRTKKVVEDRSSKMDAESVARRALAKDPNALQDALPALRDRSRQAYLGKREQQQLDLLRLEIADDERDFRGVKLTRREQDELNRKKELLRLAEERLAIDEGFDGYQMPDGMSKLCCHGCSSFLCAFLLPGRLLHRTR